MKKLFIITSAFIIGILSGCNGGDGEEESKHISKQPSLKSDMVYQVGPLLKNIARHQELRNWALTQFDSKLFATQKDIFSADIQDEVQMGFSLGHVVGLLLESVARTPVIQTALIADTEKYIGSYSSGVYSNTMLQFMRVQTLEKYLESVARQPELQADLENVTQNFIGPVDSVNLFNVSSDQEVAMGQALGRVVGKLIEGSARQPEKSLMLLEQTEKYIGNFSSRGYSDTMLRYMRVHAIEYYLESIARQPELKDDLENVMQNFIGPVDSVNLFTIASEQEVAMGQALGRVVGKLIEVNARQPEMSTIIIEQTEKYIGSFSLGLYNGTTLRFMRAQALEKYIESIARQPERRFDLESEMQYFIGPVDAIDLFAVSSQQEVAMGQALGRVVGKLIESSARQPEISVMLLEQTEKYIGNFSLGLYRDTMLRFMKICSLEKYLESITRQPELQTDLENAMRYFVGSVDSIDIFAISSGQEIAMGRALGQVVGKLIEGTARQPENTSMLLEQTEKYIGNLSLGSYSDTVRRFMLPEAVTFYIESSLRVPERNTVFEDILLKYIDLTVVDDLPAKMVN